MNKEQATHHIKDCLRNGDSPAEIAIDLSRLLNAPVDITRRFVDQVAASLPSELPVQQAVVQDPHSERMPDIEKQAPIHPAPPIPANNFDLPPGLQAILIENQAYLEPIQTNSAAKPSATLAGDLPRQATFTPPKENPAEDEIPFDQTALTEEVLHLLKKKRRHNDIVEGVCNKTGWHWNKAQRFVAQVKTKNFEELQSTQNRTTIIVGTIIILIGLAMALAGASTLADYAKIAVFARTNPEVLLSISPEFTIFALIQTITGLGMIVGGGYGVSRAITDH